ncbi:GTP-binding protein Obg/CgtA [Xylariomycetidae sp. FL0641]|nr:GTP-binding protein Obg/CgtA [Xylariomycetidae sp. FL0641]
MPPRCSSGCGGFLPFLYPTLFRTIAPRISRASITTLGPSSSDHERSRNDLEPSSSSDELPRSRLNPAPDDYAIQSFADYAKITVVAGGGGHGCISFLKEAFVRDGPPNGGDGGHGGNIYIQAVSGESSLHKLARQRVLRAGRGKAGQGSGQGGARGADVVLQVPVGTVVRELSRVDPEEGERERYRAARREERAYERLVREAEEAAAADEEAGRASSGEGVRRQMHLPDPPPHPNAHKFLLYPGISSSERSSVTLPRLPLRERLYAQPEAPVHLDLSTPGGRPVLLAAGGVGGLGNPHFASKERPRPLFATKGEPAVRMELELELKLLADVGLVGLPNAGKSTLLRALTRSRARVGNWAFTTLQPNIGTVVLDNYKGRPFPVPKPSPPPAHAVLKGGGAATAFGPGARVVVAQPEQLGPGPEPRARFTVADIPGLVEDASRDRGLGLAFLRHVERAGVLAFVVDLGAGDAVRAVRALWTEVGVFARMRADEERDRRVGASIDWEGDGGGAGGGMILAEARAPDFESATSLHITAKPWFVVATKGDLPETQQNFARLKEYLDAVTDGREPHPSGVEDAWTDDCVAIPVSAINGHGVDHIVHWTVGLLDT